MGVMGFEGIVPQEDIIALLIGFGIPLVGALLVVVAVGYAYGRYIVRKKIEEASARVLHDFPEFMQTKADFRAFAQKVLAELGWNSVSFTYF